MVKKTLNMLLIMALVFQTLSSSLFIQHAASASDNDSSVFSDITFTDNEGEQVDLEKVDNSKKINVEVSWSDAEVKIKEDYSESLVLLDDIHIEMGKSGSLTIEQGAEKEDVGVGTYDISPDGTLKVIFNEFIQEFEEVEGTIYFDAVVTSEKEEDGSDPEESTDNPSEESVDNESSTDEEKKEESDEINEDSAEGNEETGTENEEAAEGNEETVTENEEAAEGNEEIVTENEEATEGNEETGTENEEAAEGNEETGTENEEAAEGNEETGTENEEAAEGNEETGTENEEAAEDNEKNGTKNELNDQDEYSDKTQSEQEKTSGEDDSLATAHDFSAASTEITENIITGVTLTRDGTELQDGEEIVIESPYSQSKFVLDYDFALPNNHTYGEGSTFTIEVPEMFNIPQVPDSEQQDLVRGDGTVFGTFYTDSNDIIITFNENIQMESDISGNISLESNMDDNYDGPATGDTITFPVAEEENVEFPIKFIPDASAIEKQGSGNRGYNTETIEWTVDFNKNLQTIGNAVLEDVLTEGGHSFIDGSLKVYQLDMNANGNVDGAVELTDHGFGSVFPLELGTIDSAYRVVYETEVNDMTGETYKNNVTLTGDEYDPVSTEASVSVTRGQPLEKEAVNYDDVSQTITWEVRYNYDEKVISQEDAKLTDSFGDNQELVDNSFDVKAVEIDQDTGEEVRTESVDSDDYSFAVTDDGFEFQFTEQIDGAYKILYQTTAIDRVDEDITVDNTILDEFNNTSEGSSSISQGIFIKSHGSTDYEAKETTWSVIINRDEQVMKDVVFTDTLPEGFSPEEFEVLYDGAAWSNDEQYIYSYDESTREIRIEFNQDLEKRVDIRYTTFIDFDEAGRGNDGYTNNAVLEWVPEGQSETVTREGEATFDPDDYTKNNGFKYGNYDIENKEITWTIGVNYNNETLNNAVVKDYILGNQNFDIDSVKVYEMNLTGSANGYEPGDDVTDAVIEAAEGPDEEPGFTVTLGDITTGYVIQYTTDLNGQIVKDEYNNEAIVSSSNNEDIGLSASVTPRYGGEFSTKTGQQNEGNGRIVNWGININFSQSTVTDFEIVDTPSVNQTILRDTVVIYGTTIDGNNIKKDPDAVLEEGEDYSLEFAGDESGQESFTVEFNNEVDRAYVLEYDTYILYEGDGKIANTVMFEGEGEEDISGSDGTSNAISFDNIRGSISGEVGSLQVTKVDFDDTGETLEGATFELYDDSGEVLLRTAVTDEDGIVEFNNLLYGDYLLKESEAPEGYVAGIDDTETVTVNQSSTEVEITNKEIKRHVQLTKVDGTDGETLEGVIFELWDAIDDSVIATFTTDENGFIYIEDLEPGDYYFVETQPAVDYQGNTDEHHFTIDEKQTEIDEVTVENELIQGSAFITKVDADNPSTGLEGAVFEVQAASGVVVRTVTSNEDGLVETGDLRPGYYQLVETGAPFGFEAAEDEPIAFEIERSQDEPIKIGEGTIDNGVQTTSIELTKIDDINGQPLAGAEFTLTYKDGKYEVDEQTAPTNEDGIVIFEGLKPGTYKIDEIESPEGYIKSDEAIEIEVTLDDVGYSRTVSTEFVNSPYADVQLQKEDADSGYKLEGAVFDVVEAENPDNSIDGFTGLVTDENGELTITGLPIGEYQLKETAAPNGYTIKGDGLTEAFEVQAGAGTETLTIETVENNIITGAVALTKIDGDSEELLEGVEFTLRATSLVNNGSYDETTHTTDENGQILVADLRPGQYVFKETEPLDGYQGHWGDIEFEIEFGSHEEVELDVLNYELVDFNVVKQWNDDGDEAGLRPETITVDLLQNGEKLDEANLTSDDNWGYTFEELEAVDSNGEKYDYTIAEQDVANYQLEGSITGNAEEGFEMTNVQIRDIDVAKTWQDDDNRLEDRPDNVTIHLLQNEDPLGETVTISEPWTYTFTDLPVYDANGALYDYTIIETDQDGNYTLKDITGDMDNGFEIINVRSGEKDIAVFKEWRDEEGTAVRPDSISIELFQKLYDEEEYPEDALSLQDISPDSEGDWTYVFEGLPAFNDQGKEYDYKVEEIPVAGYDTSISEVGDTFTITNVRSGLIEVEGGKIWLDNNWQERPDEITVELTREGDDGFLEEQVVTEDGDWTYSFTGLDEFDSDGIPYTYTVEEAAVPEGYEAEINGYDLINTRTGTTAVEVEKIWFDEDMSDRPDEITLKLFQNNVELEEVIVTDPGDGSNWVHVFEELPAFDDEGKAYLYTVEEEPVAGYEQQSIMETDEGFSMTNVRSGETSAEVTKEWMDDESEDRPDKIEVNLLQNGNVIETQEITAEDDWGYTFENLPKYDNQGVAYSYSIEEEPVSGYETLIDGFHITNLRVGTVDVNVTKTWLDDDPEDRPETIVVNLLQDGVVIETQEINADMDWAYSFTGLDGFNDQGEAYAYTVTEHGVPGYESEIDGFEIINTRTDKTSVTVTKSWLDGESGDRPEKITVDLLKNGAVFKTVNVTADNDWEYKFENLDAYDENGQSITYTVEEHEIEGYASYVNGYDITNVRSGEISAEVTKEWLDDESEDRPVMIEVVLLQNGEVFREAEVTAENGWIYTFENLPEYDDQGIAYSYTVEEKPVRGYESSVEGFNITNLRIGIVDVEGTKTWLDSESEDRPDMIEVTLLQNGEVIRETAVTAEDNWMYRFEGLPEYDEQGAAYIYKVVEDEVEGYESIYNGYDIINVRTGVMSVSGTKTWQGDNENDRPETIVVVLYQNGETFKTKQVTAADNWKYAFMDLPKFDEKGVKYDYTIGELEVDGYRSDADGFNLTNTLIPKEPEEEAEEELTDESEYGGSGDLSDEPADSEGKKSGTKGDGGVLPQTATSMFSLLLFGAMFILTGFALLIISRIRQRKA
ncbi:Cna B-type domain-containing protein [Salipaludibacillus sp. CUR1]|uniref:Cna B-type domain-containing protein n=1 Tax=Salipaludibacillus sp. CUR1 TaxID=2820003 RepID=UPI001E452AF5|nr:Cna B-type domain-containing protein [Salipaludibacillus sp. CUR1]MCE7791738.1 Cna B-type domain-containing protein [Salipaludibacillus sp. CUR1]